MKKNKWRGKGVAKATPSSNNNKNSTVEKKAQKKYTPEQKAAIDSAKREIRNKRIEQWYNMPRKDITKMVRQAARGNREAQKKMLEYSWAISTETNMRIQELRDVDKLYGGRYNRLQYFFDTEYYGEDFESKAATPVQLHLDWYSMRLQNDQATHWLTTDVSTVSGQIAREKHRLAKLHELEILPSSYTYEDSEEFLRWLGNEEVSAAIDDYGTSDTAVEMFRDVWMNEGKQGLRLLQKSFVEYQAARQLEKLNQPIPSGYARSFDEAMLRRGIKVEDYMRGKPTS